jgi:1-acyl-sn-glycerol-3-phosphate acyltransferase
MSTVDALLLVLAAVGMGLVAFVALLPWVIQPILRLMLFPRYGFKIRGKEHIPRAGAAVLVTNHVTWIDGLFLAAACPRHGKILANAGFFRNPVLSSLARRAGIIPIPFSGPKAQRAAIHAARDALDRGELLAIFPEGQLTRNGLLGPFYRGLEVILKGHPDVPVVPVGLDNLWGSIWSFQGGRAFGKRPVGLRRTIHVAYGPPIKGPPSLFQVRLAILEAGVDAIELRGSSPGRLETLDLGLPHLEHQELGLLTASAPDFNRDGIVQPGCRDGTCGLPLPGVALRVRDDEGRTLGEDSPGHLEARVAGHPGWMNTGLRGSLDRDGFLRICPVPRTDEA